MTRSSTDRSAAPLDLERYLLELCAPDGGPTSCQGLGLRRLTPSPVDARLFFADAALFERDEGRALLARLRADPLVESLQRKGGAVSLRLADDYVAELGARLESDPAALARTSALAGRSYVVNFLNPNATKPLHVGHLRNVSIGDALASLLAAAGARVRRQCYVCDIGRSVCEAMAGYETFRAGQTPDATGQRSDQFVGACYADYANALGPDAAAADAAAGANDPAARETQVRGDRADELMRDWQAGRPEAVDLWQRIRAWALTGQAATLARLGVALDRRHFESDSLAAVQRFVRRGLAAEIFRAEPDGAVSYPTGRAEYDTLKLVRSDGFPTEHARVIALFLEEQADAAAVDRWIVVCGDEWDAAGGAQLDIARRLGDCPLLDKVQVVAHGMVTLAGSKMKSRDGKALLVDDFLDRIERSDELTALLEATGHPIVRSAAAEILVKGSFLSRRISKAVEFEWEAFTDPVRNPAWSALRAWCRAASLSQRKQPPAQAEPSDPPAAPAVAVAVAYRTAVMQVHQYRQLLAGAAQDFQGTEMIKFAIGLSSWYAEQGDDARLARAVRAILAMCFASVGIRAASEARAPRAAG